MRSWFLDFWREKEENPKRTNQLRLRPRQLKRLLGDTSVRTELQNGSLAGLLPPVGTEVFRRFTPASLQDIQQHAAKEAENQERKSKEVEKELQKQDLHLEEGKHLPFVYGDPPPELLNCPLEELDPFYQSQKTFIVLSKGNLLHRFNAESSCLLLSPFSRLRSLAVRILVHSLFRLFLMVTILTNCVFMTISDHPTASRTAEFVFTAVYVFEVIVKILSRGFCVGRFTFLRDPWNWLDIVVVVTAILPEFFYLGTFSVLRTTPRVLKIIAVYPGVKSSAGALFQSVKRLIVVVMMTVAVLSIVTLISQYFFMGYLRQKCIKTWTSGNWTYNDDFFSYHDNSSTRFDYQEFINNKENQLQPLRHLEPLLCGNKSDAGACPHGYICVKTSTNPNYGYTSFDSFGLSLLNTLRLMTNSNWEYLLEEMMRSGGALWSVAFVLFVFFVGFCLLVHVLVGLALAVVEQEKADLAEARRTKEEFLHIVDVIKKREEEEEETQDDQRLSPCLSAWTCDCCGCWRWLSQLVNSVVTNPFFDFVIIICLILNCIMMAVDHYPMTEASFEILDITSLVFTAIFTAEMILRLVAMNPCNYFRVGWHIYDSITVLFSLLDLFIAGLQFVPLTRVLRLARWWPAFHMFMKIIWSSVWALRNLTLILLTVVFLFTVVGTQLFQTDYSDHVCRISEDCLLPRLHMNDLYHTFVLNFMIFCGDWIENLWDCMQVSGPSVCLMYFMSVLVIGHLLVLNLFLVLLMNLAADDLVTPKDKEENNLKIAIDQIKMLLGKKNPIIPQHKVVNSKEDTKESLGLKSLTSDQPPSQTSNHGNQTRLDMPENEEEKHRDEDSKTPKEHTPEDCCCCNRCCPFLDIDTSQGSGKVWSNFRRVSFFIAQHTYFEGFIIFIIILSSAALVLEDINLQQLNHLPMILDTADHVFAFIFLLEMLLKWAALGFKKYFTSFWCWLDFLVLAVSLMSLNLGMLGYSELGAGLSLRTLRTLRPLRILSRFQCLRLVLSTLMATVPSMCEAMLVCLLVWLMFSTMGVHLFSGKFYACLNATSEQIFLAEEVSNMSECLSLMEANFSEVNYKNQLLNFDNVLAGYWSLLLVATSNGWLDVMYSAVDSTQVLDQPQYEWNVYMYIYFICFIIIGCFFASNLFIRFFIRSLDQLRHKFGGKHFFMTDEQQIFSIRVKKWFSMKRPSVPRPQNCCQASLSDLVSKKSFEIVKVIVICLNLVTMMTETFDDSSEKEFILYWMYFGFHIFFLIECILKIIAFRKHYFSDCFNVLDFVVVLICVLGTFISDLLEKYFVSVTIIPLVRCAHVVRMIHLIPYVRGIHKLFVAFVMSLPVVFNICLLLFLLMFTFSAFGMFAFAPVGPQANDVLNFESFRSSMTCMFTITMMDGAGTVMIPTLISQQDCDPDKVMLGNCVHPTVRVVFFISYISLSLLLVVLLYTAVVLETLNMYDAEMPSDNVLQMFYKTWSRFDRDTSQVIPYSELSDFCDALQAPLRIPKPNALKLIHMDLPLLPGDKIHCLDILSALTVQRFGDQGQMDTLKARMEEKFHIHNLSKMSQEPIGSTLQRKQEEVAATVIQKAYRKHRLTDRDEMTAEPAGGAAAV